MYRFAVGRSRSSANQLHQLLQSSSPHQLSCSTGRLRQLHSRKLASLSFPLAKQHRTAPLKATSFTVPSWSTNGLGSPYLQIRSLASGSLPPHTKVPLPALSPTMERGSIKSWEKKEGDKLNEGDLLALIETDKATMDFETPEEGFLAKILVPGGSKDVPLGQTVCIIVPNQEDVAAFKDFTAEQGQQQDAAKSSGGNSASEQEKAPERSNQGDANRTGGADLSSFPPHMKVKLPALSPTVDQSTIKSWNKKEGDKLSEGDLIAQVETDKATIDWNWENPEEVYVAKLFVPDGTADVPVGQLVAIFVNDKKDLAAFKDVSRQDFEGSTEKPPAPKAKKDIPKEQQKEQRSSTQDVDTQSSSGRHSDSSGLQTAGGRVFASPLARSLAKSKGIDLAALRGSGPDSRVVAKDVESFTPESPSAKQTTVKKSASGASVGESEAAYQDIPMTNMRQIIAKRLLQSKQTVPHYYLSVDVVLDDVVNLRKELNTLLEKDKVKISMNDFIIKASALACKKVPQTNSAWMDTFIRQFSMVDVSVAVSTEAGLITPIVFGADTKGLVEINADVVRLADAARKGKLKPQEFQGGTFTVSNLGMFDIKNFSAVINPPQSCILAVGGAQKTLIADEKAKEGYRVATVMSVTLSCDHRVVDGAVGAQWLKHFKRCLEHPETMLL
ncbi:Dihydrolipoyllysine-residue acetyltransferase component of pyruvate dehydrogenase complex, mitochondrial [Hypsibius exemplaris]|uniref:Acetyltransferase component of pyruvate dehydrogenase complex n=1 Tax=Hypsibius exemplaris TaxID=2072580 RepID=A0A1W0X2Z6_HYPEX|nr:Dihydrolipoyllysine-residue acetyltransferase component of pyruvate dehydrogenase complex, mitochondrial [Hypsibius exemplaris]